MKLGAESVTWQDYTFIAHGVYVQTRSMQGAPDELGKVELCI